MSTRESAPLNEPSTDLQLVNQRLSTLIMEAREARLPSGYGRSEASTATPSHSCHDRGKSDLESLGPDALDTPGWPAGASESPTPASLDFSTLARSDSQVMQVKKKTKTKWVTYPYKGYKTTTEYFYEEVDSRWTAVLIVLCFFISGLVDSVSYQTFSVFTSLQTGNTILCGLRLSKQPVNRHPFAYIKSVTSIASYCLGGLFFNVLHRAPTDLSNTRPRLHRWTLFTSFIVQSTLLVIAAALAQSGWTSTAPFRSGSFSSSSGRNPDGEKNYIDLLPIGFLAFEAAGQVCLSRVLVINELPTIVISTLYHDFVADALCWRQLWKDKKSTWEFFEGQKRQIRRICCILALFTGAITGGFVYASPGGLPGALWIAAGLKMTVSVVWCVWKRKKITETIVTREPASANSR